MSGQRQVGYAGDILAVDAYALLSTDKSSMLIDVRTQAEWAYVGTPDLRALDKTPLFLEWQTYPSMQLDGQFAVHLESMLESAGVERGASLLFLCRSGARSRAAAIAICARSQSARCASATESRISHRLTFAVTLPVSDNR